MHNSTREIDFTFESLRMKSGDAAYHHSPETKNAQRERGRCRRRCPTLCCCLSRTSQNPRGAQPGIWSGESALSFPESSRKQRKSQMEELLLRCCLAEILNCGSQVQGLKWKVWPVYSLFIVQGRLSIFFSLNFNSRFNIRTKISTKSIIKLKLNFDDKNQ